MQMRGVRAQFAVHLWANRRGYCDWCHPDICKSSSCLSQETACDIMLLQMSPECAGRSHVTCRDLERSGARLGPRGSDHGWRVQQIAGFCSIGQVLCSIFSCNTLCGHSFWLLIFPICLVQHDWQGLLDGGPHDQGGLCAAGWSDHRGQIWNSVEHLPPSH